MHIGELINFEGKDFIKKENKARNQNEDLIEQFVKQINLERQESSQLKTVTFMAVKMKLKNKMSVSHNNNSQIYQFFQECMRYKSFKGSFSKCFFGATKIKTPAKEDKLEHKK